MIPQVKFVDPDSGLDAAAQPIERIAALIGAMKTALPQLPGTASERDITRLLEILQGMFGGKAAPAAAAAPAPSWAPVEYQRAIYDANGQPDGRLIMRGTSLEDMLTTETSVDGAWLNFRLKTK